MGIDGIGGSAQAATQQAVKVQNSEKKQTEKVVGTILASIGKGQNINTTA